MNRVLPGIVRFKDWRCTAIVTQYATTKKPCIRLEAAETDRQKDVFKGEPIATSTVNIPGLLEGYVAVKDYSENEGMLEALQNAGIVGPTEFLMPQGFVDIPVCKLLV